MPFFSGESVAGSSISSFLTDAARIWSPLGEAEPTVDPVTLEATYPAQDYLWEGPCLFQPAASNLEGRAGGGRVRVVQDRVKLPAGAAGFRVGDSIEIEGRGEFEIVRIEPRTLELTRTLAVRSRQDVPEAV